MKRALLVLGYTAVMVFLIYIMGVALSGTWETDRFMTKDQEAIVEVFSLIGILLYVWMTDRRRGRAWWSPLALFIPVYGIYYFFETLWFIAGERLGAVPKTGMPLTK